MNERHEKWRDELGESINPLYIESLLRRDIPGLLDWMRNSFRDQDPTLIETQNYSYLLHEDSNPEMERTFQFGLNLIDGHLKLLRFVFNEIRSRANAIPLNSNSIKPNTPSQT